MQAAVKVAILYLLVLVLVLFATPRIVTDVGTETPISPFFAPEQSFEPVMVVVFAISVGVFSVLILKFQALRIYLLRLIEAGSLGISSAVIFYATLRALGLEPATAMGISGMCGVGIVGLRYVAPVARNFIVLCTCAGASILIGTSFTPLSVAILLVLLSVYDYVAVYRTKHMHELAHVVHREDFMMSFQVGKDGDQLELGTGDVIVPASLVASASVASSLTGLLIGVGTIGALIVMVVLVSRRKELTAALPVIAVGALAGYGCAILLAQIGLY